MITQLEGFPLAPFMCLTPTHTDSHRLTPTHTLCVFVDEVSVPLARLLTDPLTHVCLTFHLFAPPSSPLDVSAHTSTPTRRPPPSRVWI